MSQALEHARAGAAALASALKRVEALSRWFKGSVIVDDNGAPMVMYHGSYKDFTEFDRMASSWRGPSIDMVGSWFSHNPSESGGAGMYANGPGATIYPVYLRVTRPKHYESFRELLNAMHEAEGRDPAEHTNGKGSPEGLRAQLKAQGYDGIALAKTNVGELDGDLSEAMDAVRRAKDEEWSVPKAERGPYTAKRVRLEETVERLRKELAPYGGSTEFDAQMVVIVFDPQQIKSAIGNSGKFDPESANILDSLPPMERARVAAQLAAKVGKYRAAGGMLPRLRLANEIRALVAELGGVAQASGPSLAKLQAIAAGQHDAMGAEYLHYELKAELEDNWGESYDQALADDAADAAHAAINRWMKVEEAEYA